MNEAMTNMRAVESDGQHNLFPWEERAYLLLRGLILIKSYFTTDDLWRYIEKPAEPRRVAGVFARVQSLALIEPTTQWVISAQGTNNRRPVRVWRSLVRTHG